MLIEASLENCLVAQTRQINPTGIPVALWLRAIATEGHLLQLLLYTQSSEIL